MVSALSSALRGAAFFSLFWPSFSRLGYVARKRHWQKLTPDFSAQTWLVTGASKGIGREIARRAAEAGATVHVAARSSEQLAELAASVGSTHGSIEPEAVDLSLLSEVRRLAADGPEVDVLVNNVGVMLSEPRLTAEGFDEGFAINLLGHYLLTETLLNNNRLRPDATVINVSSGGAYNVPLEVQPLQTMQPYNGTLAYAYQKRAQLALNAHWRERYWDRARFYVMHPGWVDTPGVAAAMPEFRFMLGPILRDVRAGADTALWLAAQRPPQRRSQGVWFDRTLMPAHYLPGTRNGDDRLELLRMLASAADSNRSQKSGKIIP